jgi:hypothetical protein
MILTSGAVFRSCEKFAKKLCAAAKLIKAVQFYENPDRSVRFFMRQGDRARGTPGRSAL